MNLTLHQLMAASSRTVLMIRSGDSDSMTSLASFLLFSLAFTLPIL